MPTIADLDGPRLAPRRGPARSLVVLLHGYGADGNDLIEIGRAWQDVLPYTAFTAPNAPHPCGQNSFGREWFPLTFRDPDERWRGVQAAAPALDRFLDRELARHGLVDRDLALVGFSQGTMMALHVGLRRAAQPAALVGFSGLLVHAEATEPAAMASEIRVKPPVLLIHGSEDELIPAQALFLGAAGLASLGIPTEWHLAHGLGHGIDEEGIRHAGVFIAGCFRRGA